MLRIFGDIPVEPFEPPVEPSACNPLWWILGVVALVAAVTAIVIVILVKKKKKGGK